MTRVGFLPRAGAYFLDIFIMMVMYYASAKLLLSIIDLHQDPYGRYVVGVINFHISRAGQLLVVAIFLPYLAFEIFLGATFGKLLLGLRIGTQDGYKASIFRLFLRFLLKYIESIVVLFVVLLVGVAWFTGHGYIPQHSSMILMKIINGLCIAVGIYKILDIFALSLGNQQTLHDILSGTAVFYGKLYSRKQMAQIEEQNKQLEQERVENNTALNTLLFK